MRKTDQAMHTAFAKAHKAGDLSTAVQLARTAVTTSVFRGDFEDEPSSLAELLRGDAKRPSPMTGEAFEYHCAEMFAALAMGIAIGQLFSPDVFTKGGTR
jgi:hypothetical protein